MKMNKWEMQSAPLDTPQGKTFKMYQEGTTKLSESSKDKKELHEIGTMTVYKDVPYVEVEMKNKKMSFKVPEDVAKDLLVLKTLGKIPSVFHYFKFSGFKASNSGTTNRPSLRISTSSK